MFIHMFRHFISFKLFSNLELILFAGTPWSRAPWILGFFASLVPQLAAETAECGTSVLRALGGGPAILPEVYLAAGGRAFGSTVEKYGFQATVPHGRIQQIRQNLSEMLHF